jgi:large subunit ribosomal protein L14
MSIQKQTKLKVTDNSGALEIMCFHIIGSTKKRTAAVGDTIIGAVKKSIPGGIVKKGDKVCAVIVRAVKKTRRSDGSYIGFGDNAVVILKDKKELDPKGTRIFGPIAREVREKGFTKIVSLATGGVV